MRLFILLFAFACSAVMANPAEDAPVEDAVSHRLNKRFDEIPANILRKRATKICACSCGGCAVSVTCDSFALCVAYEE